MWHLGRENTIPLMRRDHLVGNRYFEPLLVFNFESVMLGPPFISETVFYTHSVTPSPRFKPESAFYTSVRVLYPVLIPQSVLSGPGFILTGWKLGFPRSVDDRRSHTAPRILHKIFREKQKWERWCEEELTRNVCTTRRYNLFIEYFNKSMFCYLLDPVEIVLLYLFNLYVHTRSFES